VEKEIGECSEKERAFLPNNETKLNDEKLFTRLTSCDNGIKKVNIDLLILSKKNVSGMCESNVVDLIAYRDSCGIDIVDRNDSPIARNKLETGGEE
jgi:hypothetical protein